MREPNPAKTPIARKLEAQHAGEIPASIGPASLSRTFSVKAIEVLERDEEERPVDFYDRVVNTIARLNVDAMGWEGRHGSFTFSGVATPEQWRLRERRASRVFFLQIEEA